VALPHLRILFDNYPGLPRLTSLWGFAALIRVAGPTILFDTGSNGRVLLKNMAALGHMPESVDLIFLSHAHLFFRAQSRKKPSTLWWRTAR
jgi:7,8-dihydropterin-6-yl-methyl-4-(beta-D-ribofuranosyl)aminobenzene 5'-phosphate synthase